MKNLIFEPKKAAELFKKGRKTRSHGTYRAKRKPNSKRVVVNSYNNPQYKLER